MGLEMDTSTRKSFAYYGNGAYCYSNSTAMLLASIGEDIKPSLLEAVGGVGIGAFVLPNSNIAFLSDYSGLPDVAISKSMSILGFEFEEKVSQNSNNFPFEELGRVLKKSPVVVGPLDMGYLVYDAGHKNHGGIDHFVLLFKIYGDRVYLHDPAGFPNVFISLGDLEKAWKAKAISYKRGYYRYWHSPKRVGEPTSKEIYDLVMKNYQRIYRTGERYGKKHRVKIDVEAINFMADNIEIEKLTKSEIGMLTGFVFPLGARRANDTAMFLEEHHKKLAELKTEQSGLLGACHTNAVAGKWAEVARLLWKYSKVESEFKETTMKVGI